MKLNTDGAARGNPGVSVAGGLIRDNAGFWLAGFEAHFGICSNSVAELQALRFGLMLAWDEGFFNVICELDAIIVLELISSADTQVHPLGSLIADIRELLATYVSC